MHGKSSDSDSVVAIHLVDNREVQTSKRRLETQSGITLGLLHVYSDRRGIHQVKLFLRTLWYGVGECLLRGSHRQLVQNTAGALLGERGVDGIEVDSSIRYIEDAVCCPCPVFILLVYDIRSEYSFTIDTIDTVPVDLKGLHTGTACQWSAVYRDVEHKGGSHWVVFRCRRVILGTASEACCQCQDTDNQQHCFAQELHKAICRHDGLWVDNWCECFIEGSSVCVFHLIHSDVDHIVFSKSKAVCHHQRNVHFFVIVGSAIGCGIFVSLIQDTLQDDIHVEFFGCRDEHADLLVVKPAVVVC